jgi:hypothetical protein
VSVELDPADNEPGAADDHIERPERQLLSSREPLDPFDQEFEVGLDRTEIDVFAIASRD